MAAGPPEGNRLARGVLLQQGVQVLRLLGGLGVVTLLARRLTLPELGTYALLISVGSYVSFVRQSIVSAAIMGVAAAEDKARLNTVVSTGLAIYALAGLGSAILLVGAGLAMLPLFNIPHTLFRDAQVGVLGLGLVTALGWPAQIFDDALRGLQRFTAVSVFEAIALLTWVAGAGSLVLLRAPLWTIVTLNAAIPLLQGLACLIAFPILGVRLTLRPRFVTRQEARRFGVMSAALLLGGIADLATYSLDRAILSSFRGAGAVGLYEGPLQAQSTVRFLNGVLSAPLVPIVSRLLAKGDKPGVAEILIRALRFSMAATTPIIVLFICFPVPILTTWLGPKFSSVGAETAVFSSIWLLAGVTGVVATAVLTAGRTWLLTVNSWVSATINVVVTIGVTMQAGIWGPIVGSITAVLVSLMWLAPVALRLTDTSGVTVLRRALMPAWSTGAILALFLLALRVMAEPVGAAQVLSTMLVSCAFYWALYWFFWLKPDEKKFARSLVHRNTT